MAAEAASRDEAGIHASPVIAVRGADHTDHYKNGDINANAVS